MTPARPSLTTLVLGPYQMNCYLLTCPATGEMVIVDPGDEAKAILQQIERAPVRYILLTHAHPDHIMALAEVRRATGAPVGVHPADAQVQWPPDAEPDPALTVAPDFDLRDGQVLEFGQCQLRIVHTPGHTPGSVCLMLDERVLVGDTIFPGGPGRSDSPAQLAQILDTLRTIVFRWPDETELYPGHGPGTTIGRERPAFEAFMSRLRSDDLYGDVTWA